MYEFNQGKLKNAKNAYVLVGMKRAVFSRIRRNRSFRHMGNIIVARKNELFSEQSRLHRVS